MAAVSLGSIEDRDYTLRVDLAQIEWQGGIGVFFGAHRDGEVGWRVQSIRLVKRVKGQNVREHPFLLVRATEVWKVENGQSKYLNGLTPMSVNVAEPNRRRESLELTVRGGRLARVRWEGVDVPELTTAAVNQQFTAQDYNGEFGVLTISSDATFHTPDIELR